MRQKPEGKITQELINYTHQMSKLILKKLAVMAETATVSTAITEAENVKNLTSNLRKMLVNTKSSSSGRLQLTDYGPYCKGITIKGTVYNIMQKMFTEVSNAALQLEVCTTIKSLAHLPSPT